MKYFLIMKNACDSVGMNLSEDKYDEFISYRIYSREWKLNLTAITEDEGDKETFCIRLYKGFF